MCRCSSWVWSCRSFCSLGPKPAAADCGPAVSVVIDADTKVEGYTQEQLKNAAAIMGAGKALDLSVKGQMISVMVALGESGLRVLDYGDGAGPDSRGLFQQRDNGAWGSYADRMDPTTSATNFIKALQERGRLGAAGTDHRRQQGPAQRRPVPLPEVLARGRQTRPGALGRRSSPCKAATAPSRGSPVQGMTTRGRTLRPGCRSAQAQPAASPLGMYYRECVDFALWRVNQQMGSTSAPFKFLNGTFRPDGQGLGSALTWKAGWDAKGWSTGSTPRVGAVVWYAPGAGGADPNFGHVAVVKEVKDDGTYVEEGYNGNPPPDDHNYYTRTVSNNVPSAFLYLPTQEEKK